MRNTPLSIPRGQAGYYPLHKISLVVDFFNEVEKNYRLDTFNRKREHTFCITLFLRPSDDHWTTLFIVVLEKGFYLW
jgi:hypothetical protein